MHLRPVHKKLIPGLRKVFLALCLIVIFCTPAFAARYGDIEVLVEPPPTPEGGISETYPGGYFEFRIKVRNHSKTAPHKVRLFYPAAGQSRAYEDTLQRNSRTVEVAPDTTMLVSLFQPKLSLSNFQLVVEIDGRRQEEMPNLPSMLVQTFRYGSSPSGVPSLLVLSSRGITQGLRDDVRDFHSDRISFCRSELEVKDWSPNWLGYTLYNIVLVTDRELASAPNEVLLALRRYVETGGTLLIDTQSPKFLDALPKELQSTDKTQVAGGGIAVGFGLIRRCPEYAPWPDDLRLKNISQNPSHLDSAVRIVSETKVPIRGLLIVVIVFAVLIGPLNLWILNRWKKRMWLWWNVPAISFLTCLTIFVYSIFAEGVQGKSQIASFTLLDETTHRSTSFGFVSVYSPMVPSDGLRFSYDTEATRLKDDDFSWNRRSGNAMRSIDWTRDQHFDSGWVAPRIPAVFSIRKSQPQRERLAFQTQSDGTKKVVNGLGVDLISLHYLDDKGELHSSGPIAAGKEQELDLQQRTPEEKGRHPSSLRDLFSSSWDQVIVQMCSDPALHLKPGCYVAVVSKNPFVETPLAGTKDMGSMGVIYGIVGGAADGN